MKIFYDCFYDYYVEKYQKQENVTSIGNCLSIFPISEFDKDIKKLPGINQAVLNHFKIKCQKKIRRLLRNLSEAGLFSSLFQNDGFRIPASSFFCTAR